MIFSIYNTTTGRIIKRIEAIDSTIAGWQVGAGESIIDQDLNPDIQYLVSDTPTTRPLFSTVVTWDSTTLTADNTDTVTLSGLPNPSGYNITVPEGAQIILPGTITDGSLTLKTNTSGLYTVIIDSYPYQLYSQVITAT